MDKKFIITPSLLPPTPITACHIPYTTGRPTARVLSCPVSVFAAVFSVDCQPLTLEATPLCSTVVLHCVPCIPALASRRGFCQVDFSASRHRDRMTLVSLLIKLSVDLCLGHPFLTSV